MISIKPEWVEKILNGDKTIEIRKTMPKCELPIKCYIYCTKGKNLVNEFGEFIANNKCYCYPELNGKVVAEFTLNAVDEFKVFENGTVQYWNYHDLEKSCLTYDEISNYVGRNKIGYAWHIDDLKIYNTPKELSEFYKKYTLSHDDFVFALYNGTQTYNEYLKYQCSLKKPPQSWCYVEVQDDRKE